MNGINLKKWEKFKQLVTAIKYFLSMSFSYIQQIIAVRVVEVSASVPLETGLGGMFEKGPDRAERMNRTSIIFKAFLSPF